jgi:pyruvate dehydrogenase E2 component (dihydrolipoamide acetyltransferase)
MKFHTSAALWIAFATASSVDAFRVTSRPSVTLRPWRTALRAEGTKITMPALSSTMKEGRVVSWLKNEGDEIEAGEAIMVVESDKADMDVEAFEDGVLAKILVPEGAMAPVGEAVALMAENAADVASVIASLGAGSSASEPVLDAPAPTSASAAAPDFEFSQIDMPALSSTMKEGKVVSWLKAEGDPIAAGEAIMVVESDKADMDVEAFEDGFLAAIITGEGESGAVGAPVALIAVEEADIPALQTYAATLSGAPVASTPATTAPASPATAPAAPQAVAPRPAGERVTASPLARKKAQELGVDLNTVTGTGPSGRVTASDIEAAASGTAPPRPSAVAQSSWTPAAGVVAATPTARALAKKAKLDLATVTGTGEFGRVTAHDVKLATGEAKPIRKSAAANGAPAVELPEGVVPMTGMQRAVSNNMVATLPTPEFRVTREIQMDAFDALYQKLKPNGITVSAMLAKAVALAIEKHPIINSSFSEEGGGSIVYKKDINIAMAVAIDGGLITPVLQYANERSVVELGENWKELVGKAKSGTLAPAEYNSGTFAISNMGMFGVTHFGAILPKGIGGILAIGATQEMIVPDQSAILGMKKVKKMSVTLTCDHRQIYGADAALFLKTLADMMENQLGKITA